MTSNMADEIKPAPAGMTMILNVALEEFEKAVYTRDYETASGLLLTNLRKFKTGGAFIGYSANPALQTALYTRFCAAVISLLADSKFELSQTGFDHMASEHAVMDLLFRASAFGTSDHLLALAASNPGADPTKLKMENGASLVKFFLTYSLVSGFSLNFAETFRRSPQTLVALYAGMLSPILTTSLAAHERREDLLGMHAMFADCTLTDPILPTLTDAYMYTSYGTRRDKHDAKGTMHRLMAKMLSGVKLPELGAPVHKERPTILICLDWFNSNHAMYRCYAPAIRELRARFRLVAMSLPGSIDDLGKAEFDEWQAVPAQGLVLGDLIKRIGALAPDIIYYPSVGMSLWWVALASVRLAPIQVMTLGHPASTRSPAMDYVICEEGAIGDPALFTEEIVTVPDGSFPFVARSDAEIHEPVLDDHPEVLRIAVPAMLCKVNAEFMRALKAIQDQAGRPVEFHFFVNMVGVQLVQAAKEIRDWLPGAKVYERRHYNQYMRELRECHLHLCTFPFGGTNSNIDSMQLGLPLVAMWGDEPHQRFDGMMIRRAGLPEALIAKTVDEYIEQAVLLIQSDVRRNALRDHLLGFDLQSEFFGQPPEPGAFARAMESVYERQFDRSGAVGASAGGEAADGDGCRGDRAVDGLVPEPGQDDRSGAHADGVGTVGGMAEGARA